MKESRNYTSRGILQAMFKKLSIFERKKKSRTVHNFGCRCIELHNTLCRIHKKKMSRIEPNIQNIKILPAEQNVQEQGDS